MKNNININRQPLTQSDIGEGKYFDTLLKKYNAITKPFYKTKAFLSSFIVASVVVLFTGMYYLGHKVATQSTKQAVKYNTLSKKDSAITQKTDEINFRHFNNIIGNHFKSTQVNSDSNRIRLIKQIDITRFFKNPTDQIQLFNDSLAIYRNSLHGEISIINLNSDKITSKFVSDDSSLIEHLISITPVAKSIIDSNLLLFHRKSRLLPINGLNISTYFYDGKYIWVGASISLIEPGDSLNGQPSDDMMNHFFLFQFDNSLKKINKIYALPNPANRKGFWPDIYNFSMLDSNTIYLKGYSKSNDTLLVSYYLNNVNNQLTLQKAYRIKYPGDLPKKNGQGYPADYGIRVENGFNNQYICTFSRGLDIFNINDLNQVNLSPNLLKWSNTDSINSIMDYSNFNYNQKAIVILYNNSNTGFEGSIMSKVNTNKKIYYSFIDKNYNPIENKPMVLTNNGYLVSDLPNGTIQLITEDNGEYTLKIYKVF